MPCGAERTDYGFAQFRLRAQELGDALRLVLDEPQDKQSGQSAAWVRKRHNEPTFSVRI